MSGQCSRRDASVAMPAISIATSNPGARAVTMQVGLR
jgi:hypothetical protein